MAKSECAFGNQIIDGECTEILQTMPESSVDLIVTDPPYLVNYRDRSGRTIANDDCPETLMGSIPEMYRVLIGGRQNDALDQRAQQVSRFGAVLFRGHAFAARSGFCDGRNVSTARFLNWGRVPQNRGPMASVPHVAGDRDVPLVPGALASVRTFSPL